MKELTLNKKEQTRLQIMNLVLQGECMVAEAASLMGISERQAWRLLAVYRKDGAAALAHGNRGRAPSNMLSEQTRRKVLELAHGTYAGFNHSHLTEMLEEREELPLSRSTVRRILMAEGLRSPKKRRAPKHRSRRERRSQEGMLLQIDGSIHDWLEGRGPYLTLLGAIDDATGIVFALFRELEDAHGYFLLLEEIIKSKGVPLALYSDRHSIFVPSAKEKETLEEQLLGKREPTQFGRALLELGIQAIFALSPQAKGRIERLWGTFQSRLIAELRLAGVSSLEEANEFLRSFLPRFNTRFGVVATEAGLAYRQLDPTLCLEGVLCFKYQRTVAADNTISFGGRTLQLLESAQRLSYTHARVEVQERMDGSLVVVYQDKVIATKEAPLHAVILRARNGKRGTVPKPTDDNSVLQVAGEDSKLKPKNDSRSKKPAEDHPWKKSLLTKSLNN
jgi:transposase